MKLEQFRPPKSLLLIGGEVHYLRPFSLAMMVDLGAAYARFDSLHESINHAIDEMTEAPEKLYSIAFYFLEDKDYFPSYCKFKELIEIEPIGEVYKAIVENIVNSQPIIDEDPKKTGGQKKRERSQNDAPANWAELYLTYCSVIPCTLEQFYDLTMRQITAVLKEIGRRKNPETIRPTPNKMTHFSESDDEFFTSHAQEHIEQWRQNHNKNS